MAGYGQGYVVADGGVKMELPKNIVQIGKPDKLHKIFVEDYVISYIKQWNRQLGGRTVGLAFYGKRYTENNVRYYFLYGAAQVSGIEGRGQYLSELEREGIEQKQREFFENYDFLAWCSLSGEMPDGVFLHEQGKGLFIEGYACFFEKNESMLNFMLVMGNEEGVKEKERINQEIEKSRLTMGGSIDKRLEERQRMGTTPTLPVGEETYRHRKLMAERAQKKERSASGIRFAAITVAILLCILGITSLSDSERWKDLQVVARQAIKSMTEKKLPDIEEQSTKIEHLWEEQSKVSLPETMPPDATGSTEEEQKDTVSTEQNTSSEVEPEESQLSMPIIEGEEPILPPTQPVESQVQEPVEQVQASVSYVIVKGDTLLDICRNKYGSIARLQEVCELNGIENADDIKVGQTILLPE